MGLISWLKGVFNKTDSDFVPSQNKSGNIQTEPFQKFESNSVNHNQIDDNSDSPEFGDKAKEFLSKTGKEVVEQGGHLWNELKEKVQELDESTKEVRENVKQKAKETLEKVDNFIDQAIEKSKEKDAEEASIDHDKDGLADTPVDFGENLESKHKGFFDKAESWLENQEVGSKMGGSKPNSTSEAPGKLPTLELPKED
ncbi:MAG: hypothetical protein IPP06_03940 [Saprospiraceae bacterium]|nr:hypothetical protein [Candidatus Vicinibacter affinis]MBP6172253.1 hypothetical protein [Saprospiraceae bacterium]MBK7799432.1 hypothetical protein [Candidatus Vicinibacter affinis]MBK9643085.1 hypothetical protein [Candidatus Vicinibacter affinis]MBK9960494.1 hypothetical protein [Candidatus Vicinibacter affinis]